MRLTGAIPVVAIRRKLTQASMLDLNSIFGVTGVNF